MLIKAITLKNFRQYSGEQRIEFSTDPENPVTVILGQNTGGKTTFVRAFAWCLYGGTPEKIGFEEGTSLLNENKFIGVARGILKEVEVAVTLEILSHDMDGNPITYTVTQKQIFFRPNKLEINKDGHISNSYVSSLKPEQQIFVREGNENEREIITHKQKKEIINRIMPEDLSQYFFFWGERIETISKRANLNQAITSFTGLDVYDRAINELKVIEIKYKNEILRSTGSATVKTLQAEIDGYIAKISQENSQKDYLQRELDRCEEQKAIVQAELDSLEKDAVRIERREKLRNERQILQNKIKMSRHELITDFSSPNAAGLFCLSQARKILGELEKDKNHQVGWSNLTAAAVQEILNSGKCICGQDFASHPELRKHVEEQIAYALPNALGGSVRQIRTLVQNYQNSEFEYYYRIMKKQSVLSDDNLELDDIDEELDGLEKLISNQDRVKSLKKQLVDFDKSIPELKAKLINIDQNIDKYGDKKKGVEKNLAIEVRRESDLKTLIARRDLTTDLRNIIAKMKKEQEADIKSELQRYTQDYLNEMYSGKRYVEITQGFQIKVINKVEDLNRENETSPGFETVKNFAFIAALLTIAKGVASSKNDGTLVLDSDKKYTEPYPLVLDAPFSQADETHVVNICKLITRIAEQTILVMMEKDWKIAERELGAVVGKKYFLDKKSETKTSVEEDIK